MAMEVVPKMAGNNIAVIKIECRGDKDVKESAKHMKKNDRLICFRSYNNVSC